ncbi:nickel insertion protein [Sutterella sp.]|uniref:nickel insertion protein n=1 Tax=Sutterella sp. TaxID=1981025 RepID=UPI0026DF2F8E|nr:nickel insertion protein [Sutterella sp.]MDO5531364.1 DUF111 family protein [Sutterella sp.]
MTDTLHPVLTVRINAGFNAGSFLAGLLALTDLSAGMAGAYLRTLFPKVDCGLAYGETFVGSISGFSANILTAPEHAHRHPADIEAIYAESRLSPEALERTRAVWRVLIAAEAKVHGMSERDVHFHEVGRMANILAIGLSADFLGKINPSRLVVSPIPMNEGEIKCAHGLVPYPAPAMFAMMEGVAVRPSSGAGELVTPTGLAVLKGFGAEFGAWPAMKVTKTAQVFVHGRTFEGCPNGARFALGEPLPLAD